MVFDKEFIIISCLLISLLKCSDASSNSTHNIIDVTVYMSDDISVLMEIPDSYNVRDFKKLIAKESNVPDIESCLPGLFIRDDITDEYFALDDDVPVGGNQAVYPIFPTITAVVYHIENGKIGGRFNGNIISGEVFTFGIDLILYDIIHKFGEIEDLTTNEVQLFFGNLNRDTFTLCNNMDVNIFEEGFDVNNDELFIAVVSSITLEMFEMDTVVEALIKSEIKHDNDSYMSINSDGLLFIKITLSNNKILSTSVDPHIKARDLRDTVAVLRNAKRMPFDLPRLYFIVPNSAKESGHDLIELSDNKALIEYIDEGYPITAQFPILIGHVYLISDVNGINIQYISHIEIPIDFSIRDIIALFQENDVIQTRDDIKIFFDAHIFCKQLDDNLFGNGFDPSINSIFIALISSDVDSDIFPEIQSQIMQLHYGELT